MDLLLTFISTLVTSILTIPGGNKGKESIRLAIKAVSVGGIVAKVEFCSTKAFFEPSFKTGSVIGRVIGLAVVHGVFHVL